MSRLMNIRSLPLLLAPIVAALAGPSPAAAQGSAYWYTHRGRVSPGEELPVTVVGRSSLYIDGYGARVSCRTRGAGVISNREEFGGVEVLTELQFSGCRLELGVAEDPHARACPAGSRLEMSAQDLPWYGVLYAGPADAIGDVELTVQCAGGAVLYEATGTLTGTVGVSKLLIGVEGNDLDSKYPFDALWSIRGPAGARTITALTPLEL